VWRQSKRPRRCLKLARWLATLEKETVGVADGVSGCLPTNSSLAAANDTNMTN